MPDNIEQDGDFPGYDPQREAEAAQENVEPDKSDPDHDPYAHLRPYQFKAGHSGNAAGRPKGVRSLKRRVRDMATVDATELTIFKQTAGKIGFNDATINKMDVADVLIASTFYHAMRGKPGYLKELFPLLDIVNLTQRVKEIDDKLNGAEREMVQNRNSSTAFYESVLQSEDSTIEAKLKARMALDRLQGLIDEEQTEGVDEYAERLREAIASMDYVTEQPLGDGTSVDLPAFSATVNGVNGTANRD